MTLPLKVPSTAEISGLHSSSRNARYKIQTIFTYIVMPCCRTAFTLRQQNNSRSSASQQVAACTNPAILLIRFEF